jgi:lysophospholipase L1-like esterase
VGIATVFSVALLGGCSSAGPATGVLHYVALGDSYSSGEGNPPFDPGTDVGAGPQQDLCHRSAAAYPRHLDVRFRLDLVFRACSGAVVADVTTTAQYPSEPPQDRWVNAGTDLVTISIGGNDVDFSSVVPECLIGLVSCTPDNPTLSARIARLGQLLPSVFDQLKRRGPHAHIFVVGYPDIFPTAASRTAFCVDLAFALPGLAGPQLEGMRQLVHELDETIASAAAASGVTYVDVESAFAGHELCTPEPWVRGVSLDIRMSFHPTGPGQEVLARDVSAAVDNRLSGLAS